MPSFRSAAAPFVALSAALGPVATSPLASAQGIVYTSENRTLTASAVTSGDADTPDPVTPGLGAGFDATLSASAVGSGAASVTSRQVSALSETGFSVDSAVTVSASAIAPNTAIANGTSIFEIDFTIAGRLLFSGVTTASQVGDGSALTIELWNRSTGTLIYDWSEDGPFFDRALRAGDYSFIARVVGTRSAPGGSTNSGGLVSTFGVVPGPGAAAILLAASPLAARRRRPARG